MKRQQLNDILARLSGAESLVNSGRVCLGYTAGGNVPDVDAGSGCELHWRGSAVPWWLAPLRLIAAANRTLFEVTDARKLPTFVEAADTCFTVELYSCPRTLLAAVVRHMAEAGFMASPGEVIDQDPAYFELEINCDGDSHDNYVVSARSGSECPDELAVIARAIEDGDEPAGD